MDNLTNIGDDMYHIVYEGDMSSNIIEVNESGNTSIIGVPGSIPEESAI